MISVGYTKPSGYALNPPCERQDAAGSEKMKCQVSLDVLNNYLAAGEK